MSWTLPSNIWSPEDLKELVGDLKRYAKWLATYAVKERVGASAASQQPPAMSPTAIELLNNLHAKQTLTQAGVDKLIADLQAVQVIAPHVHFTLASAPSNGLKKELIAWCRSTIGPDTLVSFDFNATILGGMVVRYGSHIHDWSFRRQILANRAKFPEVLRRV